MIRIAVVDDNKVDCDVLKEHLRRYEKENFLEFDIQMFYDGAEFISLYQPKYDLILMDIEMPFINGMEAAQGVRQLDEEVPIIFITNMPQYAIEGYKVRALDYMLKPVKWTSFSETISRALRYIHTNEPEHIYIIRSEGRRRIDIARIYYVEVRDHLLRYHTADGVFECKATMNDAQEQLQDKHFFRIHRCYLVNLRWVDSYNAAEVTVAGDRLILSRNRRKLFLDALNCYINEVYT